MTNLTLFQAKQGKKFASFNLDLGFLDVRLYVMCGAGLFKCFPRMQAQIYSTLDETSSLETFENKNPIEENKPTMADC